MNTNTNGFNYSSEYQGHGGVIVLIFLVFLIGALLMGSLKNNVEPNTSSHSEDKTNSSVNDNYDNSNFEDGTSINSSDVDDNNEDNSSHKMIEQYNPYD